MKGSQRKTTAVAGTSKTSKDAPQPADEDPRFAHIRQDPIFRRVPKDKKRVNIDSRFGAMFHDDKFKLKYKVDKRGKPINQTTDENLKRYYNLEGEDEESDKKDEDDSPNEEPIAEPEADSDSGASDKPDNAGPLPEKTKKKLQDLTIDYARGEGVLNSDDESEDSSDADSSTSEEEDEGIEDTTHAWGELDRDAERTEEVTHRLALCNMDWDRLKSDDLMVLFNSFLPPGGTLKHVTIYPSEYGKKRLEEEELYGPRELREDLEENEVRSDVENGSDESERESENEISEGFIAGEDEEEGNSFHMEKLRKYQLNRLKYYYAVMDFDSPETANKIYTECDGLEFESSAAKIDLRFIPDDMAFDEEPRDKCDTVPATEKYVPKFFTTTALQQMKVDLTWDETDPQRQNLTSRIHDPKEKVDEEDLKAYLASSSDEDEESEIKQEENSDDEAKSNVDSISKYRNLLESIQEGEKKKKDKDVEMEITWGAGLKKATESLVKKKLDEEQAKKMTPWEEVLAKRHEKKKMKKKAAKTKDDDASDNYDTKDDNDDNESGSGDDDKASESGSDQPFSDDDVDIDMNDPFFQEELKPNNKKAKNKKSKLKEDKAERQKDDGEAAALELLLMDDDAGQKKSHFNLKKILEAEQNEGDSKSKNKRKKNKKKKLSQDVAQAEQNKDTFSIDLEDDRFNALYTSHKFNLDPSDPNYKNTKAMGSIISEKQKRRLPTATPSKFGVKETSANPSEASAKETRDDDIDPPTKISRKSELASLVKSIKRNTENLKLKKNKFATQHKKH